MKSHTTTNNEPFSAVVKLLTPDLYRYAYYLCGNRYDAEDLIQESLMRAWRAFDQLEDKNAIKSWLFTILRRENARRFDHSRPALQSVEWDRMPADDASEESASLPELTSAISRLPEKYRDPLMLYTIRGCSCREISQVLHVRKETVCTRLFRGRQKLKQMFGTSDCDASETFVDTS